MSNEWKYGPYQWGIKHTSRYTKKKTESSEKMLSGKMQKDRQLTIADLKHEFSVEELKKLETGQKEPSPYFLAN